MVASKACRDQVGLALAEIGLYPGQDALLRTLARGGSQSASAIASELRVRPPTVTKMVDRLSAGGFVKRIAETEDRRRIRVILTPKGEKALEHVNVVWRTMEEIIAQAMPAADLEQTAVTLKRVETSLTRTLDRLR